MSLEIPFRLREKIGKMSVEYGVNDEPERWGYKLLGLPYDHGVAEGFPVVRASVEYEGEGYGAVMAWIQVVRYRIADGDEMIEVDKPPQLHGSNMPYCFWGPNPSFFDAPSMAHDDAVWIADAFLTTSPDTVMSKIARPIRGFRWGFDIVGGNPMPQPLAEAPADAWDSAKVVLKEHYPEWDFEFA